MTKQPEKLAGSLLLQVFSKNWDASQRVGTRSCHGEAEKSRKVWASVGLVNCDLFPVSEVMIKLWMTVKMLLLSHLVESIFLFCHSLGRIQHLLLWQSRIWAGWKWRRWIGEHREDLPFAWPWIWTFKPNCQVWESGYKILNKMQPVCPLI